MNMINQIFRISMQTVRLASTLLMHKDNTMEITIYIFTFLFVFVGTTKTCLQNTDLGGIKFINRVTDFELVLKNVSKREYQLKLLVSWDIEANEIDFDGILYKFTSNEPDEKYEVSPPLPYPFLLPYGPEFGGMIVKPSAYAAGRFQLPQELENPYNTCDGLSDALWAVNGDGTPYQCTIPCAKTFPPPCFFSRVCSLVRNKYSSLSAKTLTLEFPVKFATRYDIDLAVYREWNAGTEIRFSSNVMFCRHELITKHNIDHQTADEFCKHEQKFGDYDSTGPAVDLRKHSVDVNTVTKRGKVTFRWMAPYDIHPDAVLKGFFIFISDGKTETSEIDADENRLSSGMRQYYEVEVSEILLDQENSITITPYVEFLTERSCNPYCSVYGNAAELKYLLNS